jgi:ribosome biogenesis protein ERB1
MIQDEGKTYTTKNNTRMQLQSIPDLVNPPKEYLLTSQEIEEKLKEDEYEGRISTFIPAAYTHLRKVPYYQKLINEKFARCLDLYLCPRVVKNKLQMDPESLLPDLPDLESLLPYPTFCAATLHKLDARVIAMDVKNLIAVASASLVRIMDLNGCLVEQFAAKDVASLAWNPVHEILAYTRYFAVASS